MSLTNRLGLLEWARRNGAFIVEDDYDGDFRYQGSPLQALAALRACIGDLDRVERVAKLTVFVAGAEGFDQQSVVANGASELLEQVFGDRGRHARSAVGVAGLPLGASVEVELIARIRSE